MIGRICQLSLLLKVVRKKEMRNMDIWPQVGNIAETPIMRPK